MMSSIKLKEIIQLHSHGNQMYRYGQLKVARDTYVEVLKLLRSYDDDLTTYSTNQVVETNDMEKTNIHVVDSTNNSMMCDNDNEIDDCDDDIKSRLSHHIFDDEDLCYQSLPNDMFSIRPINDEMNAKYMIYSGVIRLDNDITYSIELLTAVTVFNLALVFHVEGLKVVDEVITDPMSNVGITKALRLYNQASILLSSLHKDDDDDNEECYVLLAIMSAALLTNTAQIHLDCYQDVTQSKQILQKLKSITNWIEVEFVTYGMIPLQDYEVFISILQQMNQEETYLDFHFCAAVA